MENWKDIKGYEGLYQVSDLGRVKSLIGNGRILKQHLRNGVYCAVNLSSKNIRRGVNVHSLVAETFLNHNANRDYVVDHINNVKTDNRLSNLQVISHRDNCSKDRKGSVGVSFNKKNRKWVSMISIDRNQFYLGSFESEDRASISYQFALIQLDKIKNLMTS